VLWLRPFTEHAAEILTTQHETSLTQGQTMTRFSSLSIPVALLAFFAGADNASAMYHARLGRFVQRDPIGYADGMNQYEYVRSRPTTHRDPFGLERLPGNQYGDWDWDQENDDADGDRDVYRSHMVINFIPKKETVRCDEIAFIQAVRIWNTESDQSDATRGMRARITPNGWSIDRLPGKKYAWYGYNNDGKPSDQISPGSAPVPLKKAELSDTPRGFSDCLEWKFETVAICKRGEQRGEVYGAFTWGFDVDANKKLTSHKPKASSKDSRDFRDALFMWDVQAQGPAAKRNHPDQERIGIQYWHRNPPWEYPSGSSDSHEQQVRGGTPEQP
jgi:hypothetical protein